MYLVGNQNFDLSLRSFWTQVCQMYLFIFRQILTNYNFNF